MPGECGDPKMLKQGETVEAIPDDSHTGLHCCGEGHHELL